MATATNKNTVLFVRCPELRAMSRLLPAQRTSRMTPSWATRQRCATTAATKNRGPFVTHRILSPHERTAVVVLISLNDRTRTEEYKCTFKICCFLYVCVRIDVHPVMQSLRIRALFFFFSPLPLPPHTRTHTSHSRLPRPLSCLALRPQTQTHGALSTLLYPPAVLVVLRRG